MTKKEAIKICEELWRYEKTTKYSEEQIRQALSLAIKALMTYRNCRHCIHNVQMGDMRGCEVWDCDFEEVNHETN